MLRLGVPTHYQVKIFTQNLLSVLALEVPPHPWIQLHSELVVPQHLLLKKKSIFTVAKIFKWTQAVPASVVQLSCLLFHFPDMFSVEEQIITSNSILPRSSSKIFSFYLYPTLSSPFSKHIIWNKNYKSCEIVRDANQKLKYLVTHDYFWDALTHDYFWDALALKFSQISFTVLFSKCFEIDNIDFSALGSYLFVLPTFLPAFTLFLPWFLLQVCIDNVIQTRV